MEKANESRKKGIAFMAITAIAALHPETYIELVVPVCILIIACYAIRRQANLDEGENK